MTGEAFRKLLQRDRPIMLDGGMGSLLIAAGLEQGKAPDGWNIGHPEKVEAAHSAYVVAGSDIIHSNSFGSSPIKLASAGMAGMCGEINTRAVEIAKRAADGRALVAGDIGPTGLMRPPLGSATSADYLGSFKEQCSALALAGVDLISIETMYDLEEAKAALEAALETGLPVVVSMTFEKRKRGFFTIMGDPLQGALQALAASGADAVGFNCSVTSPEIVEMVRQTVGQVDAPISAQPNAGQPRVTPGGVVYDASIEGFAADISEMARLGARLLGGCCGTTPDFIRAAVLELEKSYVF